MSTNSDGFCDAVLRRRHYQGMPGFEIECGKECLQSRASGRPDRKLFNLQDGDFRLD
uniref:Uncharacterized protein n=1 Tax=Hyaloperonospora arabidopsidis (strain Emoy2) TaxID=559515 RepID=M4C1N4_HYAAE